MKNLPEFRKKIETERAICYKVNKTPRTLDAMWKHNNANELQVA